MCGIAGEFRFHAQPSSANDLWGVDSRGGAADDGAGRRTMLDQGMDIIAMPSAFTAITGKAHWSILVCARAIETLCYVLAAGQGGYHVNGRETYGHSMIVDPWGQVMNELANGSGLVCADIGLERLKIIRRAFPVLEHRNIICKVF